MELSEVQIIISYIYRSFISKHIYLAYLLFAAFLCGLISHRLDNNRLVFFRCRFYSDRLSILLLFWNLRVSRFCAICRHRVIYLSSFCRSQSYLLTCFNRRSAFRWSLYSKSLYCRLLRVCRLFRIVRCLVKLQGKHSFASWSDVIICAPVIIGIVPLDIRISGSIFYVIEPITCVYQLPLVVFFT